MNSHEVPWLLDGDDAVVVLAGPVRMSGYAPGVFGIGDYRSIVIPVVTDQDHVLAIEAILPGERISKKVEGIGRRLRDLAGWQPARRVPAKSRKRS